MLIMDYMLRAWRGEQNVAWSLLVNAICGYAITTAVILGAALIPVVQHERWGIFVLLVVWFAFVVWAAVGTTRAAIATLRDPQAHRSLKLISVLVFVGLAVLAVPLSRNLAIARHALLGW
jgi:hypothetical protein